MKNNMIAILKKCGSVVFSLLLIVCLFPVGVFADTATYFLLPTPEEYDYQGYKAYFGVNNGTSARFCSLRVGDSYKVYAFTDGAYNSVQVRKGWSFGSEYFWLKSSYTSNGKNYYYAEFTARDEGVKNYSATPVWCCVQEHGYIVVDNFSVDIAFQYTYGDSAVDPVEPIDWGSLKSPAFSTKIAGSGEASAANIDTVTWSLPYDTNNNDITENGLVDVRAVRGKWAGETAEALQGKDYTTFSLEQSGANLGTVPASQGSFTASWSNVMTALDMASLLLLLAHKITGDTWEKDGWIYQIRLRVPDDEYTGEWQTVYTATSTSVSGSDTIINNTSYNIEVNQALTEITQVNNNTSVTYTYYDTNITIENPGAGTEPESGTNLWDVLKELISGIFQLLAKLGDIANSIANIIGDLIGELLNMIQSLFLPQDIDITVNQQFEEHTQTIKESTGLFGQALNFETNLHDMFYNIEPSEPVLSWPSLTVDDVTYIPSGSINLLDYVDDSGASNIYSTFQGLISGVIYFSLFLTILRKLKGVLNK